MSEFRIFETDEFLTQLGALPRDDASWIRRKLDNFVYPQLRQAPFVGANIKKLRSYSPSTWRYRIGKFRLFYIVENDEAIVLMLTIDRRRDAYRPGGG